MKNDYKKKKTNLIKTKRSFKNYYLMEEEEIWTKEKCEEILNLTKVEFRPRRKPSMEISVEVDLRNLQEKKFKNLKELFEAEDQMKKELRKEEEKVKNKVIEMNDIEIQIEKLDNVSSNMQSSTKNTDVSLNYLSEGSEKSKNVLKNDIEITLRKPRDNTLKYLEVEKNIKKKQYVNLDDNFKEEENIFEGKIQENKKKEKRPKQINQNPKKIISNKKPLTKNHLSSKQYNETSEKDKNKIQTQKEKVKIFKIEKEKQNPLNEKNTIKQAVLKVQNAELRYKNTLKNLNLAHFIHNNNDKEFKNAENNLEMALKGLKEAKSNLNNFRLNDKEKEENISSYSIPDILNFETKKFNKSNYVISKVSLETTNKSLKELLS